MKLAQPLHHLNQMQTWNHLKHCHESDKSGSHQELDKFPDIAESAGL
jgi:hypothetical protein